MLVYLSISMYCFLTPVAPGFHPAIYVQVLAPLPSRSSDSSGENSGVSEPG